MKLMHDSFVGAKKHTKPKKIVKVFMLRLTPEQHAALSARAEQEQRAMQVVVVRALFGATTPRKRVKRVSPSK